MHALVEAGGWHHHDQSDLGDSKSDLGDSIILAFAGVDSLQSIQTNKKGRVLGLLDKSSYFFLTFPPDRPKFGFSPPFWKKCRNKKVFIDNSKEQTLLFLLDLFIFRFVLANKILDGSDSLN